MRIIRVLSILLFLSLIITQGCGSALREKKLKHVSLFVEYLVRGDDEGASQYLKGEDDPEFLVIYDLFLPKYRSLEDKYLSYPGFIQKRRARYATIRQLKRAGLLGETLDGKVGFVNNAVKKENADLEKELFREMLMMENFNREQAISYVIQCVRGFNRKDLIQAFYNARKEMALTGDAFQVKEKNGELTWKKIKRLGSEIEIPSMEDRK